MGKVFRNGPVKKEKIAETITMVDKFEKLTKEEIKLEFIKIGLEEELKENKVTIKNMKTGFQTKVKIEEIVQRIKDVDINYKILNPGGNKTAIVIGNKYSKKEKKQINDEILKKNLDVEQVGFIDTKENKLEMAGGEFCVNRYKMCNMAIFKRKTRGNRTKSFWL